MNEKKNRLGKALTVLTIISIFMGIVFGGRSIYELLIDWDIIGGRKSIPPPRPDIELTCFTCNYWEDLNNDTQMNWPKEFFGIKEIFFYQKDIELLIVAHIEKGKSKRYKKEIITLLV